MQGTIETLLRDVRRWINDRGINPTYDNTELLRHCAGAYDRVVEDVFTVTTDKPYMQFDLPIVEGKREYILPSGIGHVYEIAVLAGSTGTDGGVDRYVDAIVPTYNQSDVRWPGWLWNPPILKLCSAPDRNLMVRVTFLPRALDYVHRGMVVGGAVRDVSYRNAFRVVVGDGAAGTFGLWWCGVEIEDIPYDVDAAGLQALVDAAAEDSELLEAAGVTVTGSAGSLLLTFAEGYYPPFVVQDNETGVEVTVEGVESEGYPAPESTTFQLDTSPTVGDFDQRVNAYIGGRLRVLSAGTPFGYGSFKWQERDIIEYDPATHTVTLSSPFDFPIYSSGVAAGIDYEVLPFMESSLLKACAIETARHIQSMNGNVQRSIALEREYNVALVTARRMVAQRNQTLPVMPTPTRYLRSGKLGAQSGYISAMGESGLDRYVGSL